MGGSEEPISSITEWARGAPRSSLWPHKVHLSPLDGTDELGAIIGGFGASSDFITKADAYRHIRYHYVTVCCVLVNNLFFIAMGRDLVGFGPSRALSLRNESESTQFNLGLVWA